ncbi:alpha/beta hydrolase [Saccharopolyspora shandongensis]|uniref:alpha/beta hydrolase n=1 Tax=Saccharopolyspora shandongensis TaxID=418495 RepID=UPI00341F52D0
MTDYGLTDGPVLESVTREFAETHASPPVPPDVDLAAARRLVTELQDKPPLEETGTYEQWIMGPANPHGRVRVRVVRPAGDRARPLPVIVYLNGLGWALGDSVTHDRILRSLALGADAAVVFPEYDLMPRARYPVALEQCYAVSRWVTEDGANLGLDSSRIALAGDSSGANLAAALTLMAKERGDVSFCYQVLFCPVTDAGCDTPSYHQFATGFFLRADTMRWFWDQYAADPAQRFEITASPLRATIEQLRGLPPALIVTGEADVVRDEGEAYAAKLRAAGVPVTSMRYHGAIHDFMVIDALSGTEAAKAALIQGTDTLHVVLHE